MVKAFWLGFILSSLFWAIVTPKEDGRYFAYILVGTMALLIQITFERYKSERDNARLQKAYNKAFERRDNE